MKKLFVVIIIVELSLNTFCQESPESQNSQSLLQKSKNQKTAALLMLGGGVVVGTIGTIISFNNAVEELGAGFNNRNDAPIVTGEILVGAGALMMIASIPLFISPSHNKKKALSLSVLDEKGNVIMNQKTLVRSFTVVKLKVDLDKILQ